MSSLMALMPLPTDLLLLMDLPVPQVTVNLATRPACARQA